MTLSLTNSVPRDLLFGRQRVLWWLMSAALFEIFIILLLLAVSFVNSNKEISLLPWLAVLSFLLLANAIVLMVRVRRLLLQPLWQLRNWASNIRQGDFSARLPLPECGIVGGLTDDINRLAEWLESLALERELELKTQRERIEERTKLANELHDSLAQTLTSLKFQVRVLDDTLRQDSELAIWQEMERIESSIDEANVELRELISHFRSPIGRQGLMPGVNKLLSNLRKETGAEAVLQNKLGDLEINPEDEVQILRIIQEALANVRKHSRANMVRILFNSCGSKKLRLIIEDDGAGMSADDFNKDSDNHFGLSIMRERAEAIGAELSIESEPGEGTRVLLEYNVIGLE